MIKILSYIFLFVWNFLGLWFAIEFGKWWKDAEEGNGPEGTRRNKNEKN